MLNLDHIDVGFKSVRFFQKEYDSDFQEINRLLKEESGIIDFFVKEDDYFQLKQKVETSQSLVCESQAEYGDYQTNKQLAKSICNHLKNKK